MSVSQESTVLGERPNSPDSSEVTMCRVETGRCDLADK